MDPIDQAIEDTINRRTDIDYLLLADHAVVVQGKLYLAGGGWDRVAAPTLPHQMMVGIAAGIRVPYTETDSPHTVQIRLESSSNGEALLEIQGELDVGRPPGSRGLDLLIPMAFNLPVKFEEAGDLVLIASVDGRERKRHQVRVGQQGASGSQGS
jgi:hypothetical protein